MALSDQILNFLEPLLEDGKYYVVDLLITSGKIRPKISIYIDSDEGVSIDQCARISRKLGNELEAAETIATAYTLEVSSPGLDQPLKLVRQYTKNIGRSLKVNLEEGSELSGKLVGVTEEAITLELPAPKKKPKKDEAPFEPIRVVPLNEISKALVKIDFK